MKQKLIELKGEPESSMIMVEDVNGPLSIMDRTTRQEMNEEKEDLNNIVNQRDLTGIHRTLYPTTAHTFSSTRETFSRITICEATNYISVDF